MQEAWISPPPVCGRAPTHVTGIVGGGGSLCNIIITATAGSIVNNRLLLVLCHPLKARTCVGAAKLLTGDTVTPHH